MSGWARWHTQRVRRVAVRAVLALGVVAGVCGAGKPLTELEEDHLLSMAFQTPHTKWATPYAGGKTRVVVICKGLGTLPREIIELKQRFDLDAAAVYYTKYKKLEWLHGERGVRRMLGLVKAPVHCYVLYDLAPNVLPLEPQYELLRRVTEGAGLVLVGGHAPRVLRQKNRVNPLPAFLATGTPWLGLPWVTEGLLGKVPPDKRTAALASDRALRAFRVRKGRGVRLVRRPKIAYDVGWDTQYEYWAQLVGRAVLWAAGHEPKMALGVTAKSPTVARSTLPSPSVLVGWGGAPAGVSLSASIRAFNNHTIPLPPLSVKPGNGRCPLAVPRLPAGRYVVDVRAMKGMSVLSWASAPLVVTAKCSVKELELDRAWGEIGEALAGQVTVETSAACKDRAVWIDLCDRRDRIVARRVLACRPGPMRFQFPVQAWMPMLVRVEARLVAEGQEVARRHAYFHVTKRHRGQFNYLMWDYAHDTLSYYVEQSLARLGVTLQLSWHDPPRELAAFDIAWTPYTTWIGAKLDKNGIMTPCCWNDEPRIAAHVSKIATARQKSREHGVFVYSLGDEIHTRGACLHPACLCAYRAYLKDQYKNIAGLNVSWGTGYRSFGEVKLLDPKDPDGAEAKRRKLHARWFDRQAFRSYNFTRLAARFAAEFRKLDPKSKTGFEGAGGFSRGDDYDLLVRTLGFWSPYPGLGDEVIRSIAPREFPRSNWMGYVKEADPLIWKYWRMITRGCDSVWWWRWDCVGPFHGFLAPHLGPYAATRELVNETQVVRDGLGTLLIHSHMQDDGVAMLYSYPSVFATQVEAGHTYGSYEAAHSTWASALRDLGLQYRYVTDRMLRRGEFDAKRFKVLILPQAEAIGQTEADVIRAFVAGGGTVIADVRPGIYTAHCKVRGGGVLDPMFGVRRASFGPAAMGPARISGPWGSLELDLLKYDPHVTTAGARPMGLAGKDPVSKTPTVTVHGHGKGQAILLNFPITSYPALASASAPEQAGTLLASLLASAGVKPAIGLANPNGTRLRNVEMTRWANGAIRIVSLFRHKGQPGPAVVTLPAPAYVHNLRVRTAPAQASTLKLNLVPSRPTFLVLTPGPVAPVQVAPAGASIARGQQLEVRLTVPGAAGLHAVRVRVTTPTRAPADWLDRVVMVGPKGAVAVLPVAINDPPGPWTLRATDLYTNRVTQATYTVK